MSKDKPQGTAILVIGIIFVINGLTGLIINIIGSSNLAYLIQIGFSKAIYISYVFGILVGIYYLVVGILSILKYKNHAFYKLAKYLDIALIVAVILFQLLGYMAGLGINYISTLTGLIFPVLYLFFVNQLIKGQK